MSTTRMNPLASAMEESTKYTYGANGAIELKTSGDLRVDMFSSILQTTDASLVKRSVQEMIKEADSYTSLDEKAQYIHDIFMLAFHKRGTSKTSEGEQISDGEGCKNVFYEYILELYNYYPDTIIELFKSGKVFVYGYWKDALNIWVKINKMSMTIEEKYSKYNKFIEALRHAMAAQRNRDLRKIYNMFQGHPIKTMNSTTFKEFLASTDIDYSALHITNVGKFCVRENTSFDRSAYWYLLVDGTFREETHVNYMIRSTLRRRTSEGSIEYPCNKKIPFGAKKTWRLDNVKFNIILDVVETHFTDGTWSEIHIGSVPSVCFKRNTKALINEHIKVKVIDGTSYADTGNRFPDNEDRVKCRQNVKEHLIKGNKVNSSQMYPHQIVGNTYTNKSKSSMECEMIKAQWNSLLDLTREKMDKTKIEIMEKMIASGKNEDMDSLAQLAISSGNFLACPDVSASMTWEGKSPNRPMDIGLALSAFMSELASEEWRDIAMSFSTSPNIINLKGANGRHLDVFERIEALKTGSGGSTNYMGLHKALLELCQNKNVKDEELPVLVIFSDCDFDSGGAVTLYDYSGYSYNNYKNKTTHEEVIKLWTTGGYKSPPVIIYWNLSDSKTSVQASKDMKGVQLMGGSSPSNFKYILHGEMAEEITTEVIICGEKVVIKTKDISPWSTFRIAMDQPYFDNVRDFLDKSIEKNLVYYNFNRE